MHYRTFPDSPHPLPETLAGHTIMAAVRIPSRVGELPDLAILIGRDDTREGQPFTIWEAAVRSGEWTAYQGDYDLTWPDALAELGRRLDWKG